MPCMNRREFAKFVGGMALLAPLALDRTTALERATSDVAATLGSPAAEQQQTNAAGSRSGLKLTKEQEEKVKQVVERRDRQLAALRSRALPYDAEPAFIFRVRTRTGSLS